MSPDPTQPDSPDPAPARGRGSIELAPGVWVPKATVEFRAARSSGPGGQNVNKVNTRAELRIALADIPIPSPARNRLARLGGRRVTEDGVLVIAAEGHRSQIRNKAEALERLREMIVRALVKPRPRVPTKPTKGSERRRIEGKKRRGEAKKRRRPPGSASEFD